MDGEQLYSLDDDPCRYPDAVDEYVCDPDLPKIGGYGVVFKARHADKLDQIVAVKFLKKIYAGNPEVRRRFVEEGELLQKLNHQNCIKIHCAGEQDGIPYIIMDFVDGKNARELTPSNGLDYRIAAEIVVQAARGLHHAHTLEHSPIIHRDIKPSNIMIHAGSRRVVVTDFGLAKRILGRSDAGHSANIAMTPFGATLCGTEFYTPPEIFNPPEHENVIGPGVDIYSLGATFYELLSGRLPFPVDGLLDAGSRSRAIADITHKVKPPPLPSKIPKNFELICARAMHFERASRYQSAGELADVLQTALHQVSDTAHRIEGRNVNLSGEPINPPVGKIYLVVALVVFTVSIAVVSLNWDRLSSFWARTTTVPTTLHAPEGDVNNRSSPAGDTLESQAANAYDSAKHPQDSLEVRFDRATKLFEKMRVESPQYVRGRITYLNYIGDFCRTTASGNTNGAAATALAVLAELDRLSLNEAERKEINNYRSYFSVYKN